MTNAIIIHGAYGSPEENWFPWLKMKLEEIADILKEKDELSIKVNKALNELDEINNDANLEAHRKYTAHEILSDFPDGLDYLITGVGTGGHISGCAEILKSKYNNLKVFAVEPELSPVIGGGNPGPHPIQGIGAGFIPSILKTDLLDGTIEVSREEAFNYAVRCAKEEGILVGISTGASLAAVAKKIDEIPADANILTFCYDTGERYLSVPELFE